MCRRIVREAKTQHIYARLNIKAFGNTKKLTNTPFAHKETQLGGEFGRISDELAGNCSLVDAIAGDALN